MYTTITWSYLAGCNRAVSPPTGKAEKKSVKEVQGMDQIRNWMCDMYSISHFITFTPPRNNDYKH